MLCSQSPSQIHHISSYKNKKERKKERRKERKTQEAPREAQLTHFRDLGARPQTGKDWIQGHIASKW
jgi:hypothetical protein